MTSRDVAFIDHGTTQQSGHDGGPTVAVSTDPARTGLGHLTAGATGERLFIGVFAGTQRTGGYGVRVQRIERDGGRLLVRTEFASPSPGTLTIQVITSPAQLVSVAARDASAVREAVLVDESGREISRSAVTQ